MRKVYWTELEFAAFMVKHSLVVNIQYKNNEHYGRITGLTSYKGVYEVHMWCEHGNFEKKRPFWDFIKECWKLNGVDTFQLVQPQYRPYTDDELIEKLKKERNIDLISTEPNVPKSICINKVLFRESKSEPRTMYLTTLDTTYSAKFLFEKFTTLSKEPFGVEVD